MVMCERPSTRSESTRRKRRVSRRLFALPAVATPEAGATRRVSVNVG